MKNSTQQIVNNSIILYIIMFLNILIGLVTSREILRVLGVSDFGIYSLIAGVVFLFAFLNGSMSGAVQRYLSASLGQGKSSDVKDYFNASILVHFVIALIIIIIGESVGEWFVMEKLTYPADRREAVYWVYHAVLYAFSFAIISTPAQAMLTAYERIGSVAFFTFLAPLGRFIGVYVADFHGGDALITYSAVIFIVTIVQFVCFYAYAYYMCPLCRFRWVQKRSIYGELSSFAGWGLIGDLSVVLKSKGTSVLLNLFYGTPANASYGVSTQLSTNFINLSTMVTKAANPQIIKSYTSQDKERAFTLVRQLSKISFSILFIVSIPFLFQTDWILTLWLKTVPPYAVSFSRWAIIIALIDVSAMPLQTLSRATGNIKMYQIIIGGMSLLTLPVAYAVYYFGGGVSSIFGVIACMSLMTLGARLAILKKVSGLLIWTFARDTYVKGVILIVVTVALSYVPYLFSFRLFDLAYHILLLPLVVAILSFFFMLSKTEQKNIMNLILRK